MKGKKKKESQIFPPQIVFMLFKQNNILPQSQFLASCFIKCCKITFFPTLPGKIAPFRILCSCCSDRAISLQNMKHPLFRKCMLWLLWAYYGIVAFRLSCLLGWLHRTPPDISTQFSRVKTWL